MKLQVIAVATTLAALGCNSHDSSEHVFSVGSHPNVAVGTTSAISLVAHANEYAPSGGKVTPVENVKVTAMPPDLFRITPSSYGFEVEALAPGTAQLTIAGTVLGSRTSVVHALTAVTAAKTSYHLKNDEPEKSLVEAGAVLGRGLGYQVTNVDLVDATGAPLWGTFDITLPGVDEKHDHYDGYLFSPFAREVELPAALGSKSVSVRFVDVRFDVKWSFASGGDLRGTVVGTAPDGAAVRIEPAIYLTHQEIETLTPQRCTATALQTRITVTPVPGGTGPCRINLLLDRETSGAYPDHELIVPMP